MIYRLSHLFGIAEESFLRVTEDVLDALITRRQDVIRWPNEQELALYAEQFDYIDRHVYVSFSQISLVLQTWCAVFNMINYSYMYSAYTICVQ